MCLMCTGASYAEVVDHYVRLIDEHGWTIIPPEPAGDTSIVEDWFASSHPVRIASGLGTAPLRALQLRLTGLERAAARPKALEHGHRIVEPTAVW